jgi:hypothetical protein
MVSDQYKLDIKGEKIEAPKENNVINAKTNHETQKTENPVQSSS